MDTEDKKLSGVSIEEAKKKIKAFFEQRHGEIIDYVDLMDEFDFPLSVIVEACEELERDGKIAAVD